MTSTPYETLGVAPDATDEEIKSAYRKRSTETHPDHGGDADEFKRVSESHAILSDPEKRERFDKTGNTSNTPEQRPVDIAIQIVMGVIHERDPISRAKSISRDVCHRLDAQRRKVSDSLRALRKQADRFAKKHSGPTELTEGIVSGITSVIASTEKQLAVIDAEITRAGEIRDVLSKLKDLEDVSTMKATWPPSPYELRAEDGGYFSPWKFKYQEDESE